MKRGFRAGVHLVLAFLSPVVAIFHPPTLLAQDDSFFYHGLPYGSESTFNPFSVILNGGLDELQSYGESHSIADIPWKGGATSVWRNITAPLPVLNTYGWGNFLDHEIIPSSLSMERAQWFPNYTLHLVGGGMVYRKLEEWYDASGYPAPYVCAGVTAMVYHFVNEIVENGPAVFANEDPIPDLLIFDPLGIILFSFDGVSRYFSSTLSLNDWSFQPALSFGPPAVRNVGQNFVIKYPLTSSGRTSLFYHFGAFGMLGLSLKNASEESVSFGAGLTSKSVYHTSSTDLVPTVAIHVGPIAGIYFDRRNSLLASLVVADNFNEIVRLNTFPGMLDIGGVSPGFFVSVGERAQMTAGITASFSPVGIAARFPR